VHSFTEPEPEPKPKPAPEPKAEPAPDPWPVAGLALRTPRLELRPDDDTGLRELAALALEGVHPPEEMPFSEPWTDADPRYLGRGTLQYHWASRAAMRPESWRLHFLVRSRADGRVLGSQALVGVDFATTREVSSGSWLGLAHQRAGLGTEMRAAVLALAFDRPRRAHRPFRSVRRQPRLTRGVPTAGLPAGRHPGRRAAGRAGRAGAGAARRDRLGDPPPTVDLRGQRPAAVPRPAGCRLTGVGAWGPGEGSQHLAGRPAQARFWR
jgi:RimJ/RimL family protein N-acetyltransferase